MSKQISVEINEDLGTVTWAIPGCEPIVANRTSFPPEIVAYAALHGLKQKIGDAAAISRNPDTGKSATMEDKRAAMLTVFNRLMDGSWNKGAGDGDGSSGAGLLFRALQRLSPGKPVVEIREFIAGKSKAEQAAIRAVPRIKHVIDQIRAEDEERSAKKSGPDGEELLAGLF